MNLLKRAAWYSHVWAIKAYQRLFMRVHVWGRENIPPGPKIYVSNHITSFDSFWVTPVFTEPVHIVIGPGYNGWLGTKVLDWLEQINAMPAHRGTVVPKAVACLEKGEPVYIAPEGDACELFQLGKFFPGVARIHRRSGMPIVPIALVAPKRSMRELPIRPIIDGRIYRTIVTLRGPFCINVGEPFTVACGDIPQEEQDERILHELKRRIAGLMHDVRVDKFWL
jgi:1-acyl-sn-glycerol-3-phosphate acyltransferase